jgi:hypothetical protein
VQGREQGNGVLVSVGEHSLPKEELVRACRVQHTEQPSSKVAI